MDGVMNSVTDLHPKRDVMIRMNQIRRHNTIVERFKWSTIINTGYKATAKVALGRICDFAPYLSFQPILGEKSSNKR